MGYTTPNTVTNSDVLTSALWNTQIRDNFEAVAKPITVRAITSGSTSSAPIQFAGPDVWDTASMHNPAVNNSRITLPVAGIYLVMLQAQVTYTTNYGALYIGRYSSAGTPYTYGGDTVYNETYTGSSNIGIQVSGLVRATANDYLQAWANNTNGIAVTTTDAKMTVMLMSVEVV